MVFIIPIIISVIEGKNVTYANRIGPTALSTSNILTKEIGITLPTNSNPIPVFRIKLNLVFSMLFKLKAKIISYNVCVYAIFGRVIISRSGNPAKYG